MLPYCDELGSTNHAVSCQGARVEHPQDRADPSVASRLLPTTPRSSRPKDWSWGHTVLARLAEGPLAEAETEWVLGAPSRDRQRPRLDRRLAGPGRPGCGKGGLGRRPRENRRGLCRTRRANSAGRLLVTITNDWFLEVTVLDAHKASGVAAVAASAGISREAVLAFGDGHNDVSLLSWAGLLGRGHAARASLGPGGSADRRDRWRPRIGPGQGGSIPPPRPGSADSFPV